MDITPATKKRLILNLFEMNCVSHITHGMWVHPDNNRHRFNDIDFCLRLGQAGYRLLYTPHAELIHHESVSRGQSGHTSDFREFLRRWEGVLRQDDHFYNPNLGRFSSWCALRWPGEDEKWWALIEAQMREGGLTPVGVPVPGPDTA